MISAVAHVSFTVSDLERSLRFYRDLLGFELRFVTERGGPGSVTETILGIPGVRIKIGMLALGDFSLELIEYIHPAGHKLDLATSNTGATHLAFFVDDIEKRYEFLASNGVSFKSRPVEIKGRTHDRVVGRLPHRPGRHYAGADAAAMRSKGRRGGKSRRRPGRGLAKGGSG